MRVNGHDGRPVDGNKTRPKGRRESMRGYVCGCREIPVEQIEVQHEGQDQLKGLESVYLGLLDRKRRLQTSIAPAV